MSRLGLVLGDQVRLPTRPEPAVSFVLLERMLRDPPRAAAVKRWAEELRDWLETQPTDDVERRAAFAAVYNRLNEEDAAYELNVANAI